MWVLSQELRTQSACATPELKDSPGSPQLRMAHHLFHRRRLIEGLPILHTAYTIIHTTSLTRIKPTASLLATLYMLYIMYKTHTHLHTSADASLQQDITPPPSMVCRYTSRRAPARARVRWRRTPTATRGKEVHYNKTPGQRWRVLFLDAQGRVIGTTR